MDGAILLRGSRDLRRYLASYHDLLGRPENQRLFDAFIRGQLGPIERKGLQPIADLEGVHPRSLQLFFFKSVWDEDAVRRKLQRKIARKYGGSDGLFIVDETSDGKKGKHTAGVARQYCGESGKVENCIVSVHVTYARGDFHSLIDGELFLPESWDAGSGDKAIQKKCRRAGIPEHVGHVPKPEMALTQLRRALANGLPGRYVVADEFYGDKPKWRLGVEELGLDYVVEVSPSKVRGWCRQPEAFERAHKRTGQPLRRTYPAKPAKLLGELRDAPDGFRFRPWTRFRVKDTHKGPEVWEFKETSFWENRSHVTVADGFHYPEQRLLVGRNVRTGEWKFFLTNDLESSLEKLVGVAFSRWRVERCFQDCKQELGLNHAEIRSYRGLQRHFILIAVVYYFLRDWVLKRGLEKGGASRSPRSQMPSRSSSNARPRAS